MGKLIYSAIASLDEYVEDADGRFDWAAPDEELHAFVNDFERPIGTYLYGRRMYETMVYWETEPPGEQSAASRDFAAIWRAAEKVVYSSTLRSVSSARTRLAPTFDPDEVRALKQESPADLSIGGAQLAAHALAGGLVDELHLILVPVLVGGGRRALPGNVKSRLELMEERGFPGGAVSLRYHVRN